MKIPLVCLSFNQPSYLLGLINHWQFYHPNRETHPIYVFDNCSNSAAMPKLADFLDDYYGVKSFTFDSNNFIPNLTDFINRHIKPNYDYYVLSDCDILPHPSIPWNYLDVFKHLIDSGYHRAGFGLITDDLPDYCSNRANIIHNETELLSNPISFEFEGQTYEGYRAPVDTTFALYTTKNRGWTAPMSGKDWGNCARVFKAHHLPWYLDPDHVNPEMDYYFKSVKKHVHGQPSAGSSTHRPTGY